MTVQHSLHRGSHGSSSVDVHTEKDHHRESQKEQKENKEQGSGRPRAGSESSRNPVSKVMDLIRHRSHSALSADDKRKAVSGPPYSSRANNTAVAFVLDYQSNGISTRNISSYVSRNAIDFSSRYNTSRYTYHDC